MIDRQSFFTKIKEQGLFKALSQSQVDGLNTILNEWESNTYTDLRWLSYELATIHHETGQRFQPVKEFGSEKYLKSKKYYPYYGRDYCQTTWLYNYQKVKDFTGIDVVTNPDLIADPNISAKVALYFMVNGLYTGKKLGDYFNDKKNDPLNARRIINGVDKKDLIASYYQKYLNALS